MTTRRWGKTNTKAGEGGNNSELEGEPEKLLGTLERD